MERFLAPLVAVILGVILFPIGVALAIWGWVKIGGADVLGMVCALAAGVAVFVFLVWKAPSIIRRGFDRFRAKAPEPYYSCLAMGFTCALTVGAPMAVPILLLGHMVGDVSHLGGPRRPPPNEDDSDRSGHEYRERVSTQKCRFSR